MKVLNTDNQVWGGLLYNVPKELKRYGGVYIISPYSSPTNKNTSRVKVKIGYARHNLYERIDSYHTGAPDSFWIYSVITCKNEKSAFELEQYIHKLLLPFRYKNAEYEARLKGEWFKLRKGMLKDVMNKVMRDKYDLIRGLFNYNPDIFKLSLPDLGGNPPRKLYPSGDQPEERAGIPDRRTRRTRATTTTATTRKKPTYVVEEVPTNFVPPKSTLAPPLNKKRGNRKVAKVKPGFKRVPVGKTNLGTKSSLLPVTGKRKRK